MHSDRKTPEPAFLPPLAIPYVPQKIDLEDLVEDNKLLTTTQIAEVKRKLENAANGRHKKNDLGIPYDITKINDEYYAIYKGAKQGKAKGSGAFGTTKFVQHLDSGKWAIIKIIRPKKPTKENKKNEKGKEKEKSAKKPDIIEIGKTPNELRLTEAQILKKLNYNLGNYHRKNGQQQKQEEILMKLAIGEALDHLIQKKTPLAPIVYFNLPIKLIKEVQKLQEHGILHRDIKPENIIYDAVKNKLRLVDYGMSIGLKPLRKEYKNLPDSGSLMYMAPEISTRKSPHLSSNMLVSYNEKTEMYAVGVTIYHVIDCLYLESDQIEPETNQPLPSRGEVNLNHYHDNAFINVYVSKIFDDFIAKTQQLEPTERPTFKSALKEFQSLRDERVDLASKVYNVGVIDLAIFDEANKETQQAIFNIAHRVDEVIFCDQKGQLKNKYVTIKRLFEIQEIYVSNKVIQYDELFQDLPFAIADYFHKKSKKSYQTNTIYFLHDTSKNPDFQKKLNQCGIIFSSSTIKEPSHKLFHRRIGLSVRKKDLDKAINELQAEFNRLEKKDQDQPKFGRSIRMGLLENTIHEIQQRDKVQFGIFMDQIKLLSQALGKNNGSSTLNKTQVLALNLASYLHQKSKAAYQAEVASELPCSNPTPSLATSSLSFANGFSKRNEHPTHEKRVSFNI